MTHLVFHKLTIMSKTEAAAREIPLKPGANVLSGTNDVGKSTFIKSLYHALGADTPQLNNTRWKKARPIYCLHFSVGEKSFHIVRDENTFGVFNSNLAKIGHYQGIARDGGVAVFINDLLGFRIQLPDKNDELKPLWPSFYFLPFYVDQDAGWQNTWTSFNALQSIKSYRKAMLEYHLGVRPQAYYDAMREKYDVEKRIGQTNEDMKSLISVLESYKSRKAHIKLDVDRVAFQREMEELVDKYNIFRGRQVVALDRLKGFQNDLAELDLEVAVLRRSAAELQEDFEYVAEPGFPDEVACPTCSTNFESSIKERFGILDDVDYCRSLIDHKRKKRLELKSEESGAQKEYDRLSQEMSVLDEVLSRKRGDVTFAEIVKAEGYKDVIESMSLDLERQQERLAKLEIQLKALKKDLRSFGDGAEVRDYYQARMKEYLNALNVRVLEEKDYSTIYKVVKENALGSDLPRALVAQYFAFLAVMRKFNEFVLAPMVVDSPFQQEQDAENRDAITEFIFSHTLPGQQLVLATVDRDGAMGQQLEERDVNVIRLEEQYSLLSKSAFRSTIEWLAPLHEATLAGDSV